ncbi:hypothetical protein [Anaerosporobacter sp.]|uniref:hypothetical protein n=1 Tax=Anaerosporobacter sp. TaxID=1872529 RepID=UPI00286F53C1|nr:hypothetical protein [Anaerosporobacter sp.]
MQSQQNKLTISEFEALSDEEVSKYVQEHERNDLVELLLLIRNKRAVRWKDRAMLQMIEKSPLTLWASNSAYKIVLWAGTCIETYNRNLIDKQFPEIMSIYERAQAMDDSIRIIEADEETLGQLLVDFKNYYTKDMQGTRTGFNLVTNSMQLVDDETGEKYYAEIGLPIDLEKALEEHQSRQKEFDECVKAFKESVRALNEKYTKGISELRSRIDKECSLESEQKTALRKLINDKGAIITSNLNKSEKAFDFEQFLQDNKEAIDSTLNKLNDEMENAINQLPSVEVVDEQESPAALKIEIDRKMEIIHITFGAEIEKRTSAPTMNSSRLEAIRTEAISTLQSKRDQLIRDLTSMKESVDSSPSYALNLYRQRLDVVETKMRAFIDDINGPKEREKNGKKK